MELKLKQHNVLSLIFQDRRTEFAANIRPVSQVFINLARFVILFRSEFLVILSPLCHILIKKLWERSTVAVSCLVPLPLFTF